MPRFEVYVPDSDFSSGARKTAGQFVADYMIQGRDRSRVFDLPHPVRLAWTDADDRTKHADTFRRSISLFRQLERIAAARGTITAASWRGARLGAGGLYALNYALRTPRGHKRGINIVRAFLEDGKGPRIPFGSDWLGLLAFLEIRPLFFALKKAAQITAATAILCTPATVSAPETKHYVQKKTGHKKGKPGARKSLPPCAF